MDAERRRVSLSFIDYVGFIVVLWCLVMALNSGFKSITASLDRIATALEAKETKDGE